MVDFNNESTISIPAADINRVLYIQRHDYVIDALEGYNKLVSDRSRPPISVVKSRVYALWLTVKAWYESNCNKAQVELLKTKVDSNDFKDLEEAFCIIDRFLYDNNLLRLDLKRKYDTTNADEEDRINGL